MSESYMPVTSSQKTTVWGFGAGDCSDCSSQ